MMQSAPCAHIHAGQFGMVYKAEMKKTEQNASENVTVAVKTVAQITLDFRNEVTIMSEEVHPNIVRLYGLIIEGMIEFAMHSDQWIALQ